MTAKTNALVLEDNQNARNWLEECVREAFPGAMVSPARNLAEARHLLQYKGGISFDLALIDIGLPDGSGIDMVHQLSRDAPQCLAVVTTTYDDDDHIFRAIQAGAQGYLLKYHETGRLVELLRRIHDGEPPLSPAIARRVLGVLQAQPAPQLPEDDDMLTQREREVLGLLGRGFSLAQVAADLSISQNTAASHVKAIYRKLNISTRAQAAVAALDRGLMKH